jgi:hypothetical protein
MLILKVYVQSVVFTKVKYIYKRSAMGIKTVRFLFFQNVMSKLILLRPALYLDDLLILTNKSFKCTMYSS